MNTKNRYTDKGVIADRNAILDYYHADNTKFFTESGVWSNIIHLGGKMETLTGSTSATKGVNEVEHEVIETSFNELQLSRFESTSAGDYIVVNGTCTLWDQLSQLPQSELVNYSVTYPKTPAQVLEEARSAFYDVNETDNLLNIVEAGQTISSLVQLGKMLNATGKSPALLKDLRRQGVPSWKWSSTDVSNMYLAWSFGFAPLIADAKKVAKHLPRLKRNLLQLARNSAKPHAVTRRCTGIATPTVSGGGWVDLDVAPTGSQWRSVRFNNPSDPLLIGGVFGQRSVNYKTDEFQILDYLMGRYIATGPISLAWEKVKYSFAVDWFINVTGLIDRMDNALTGNTKKIERAWTSEKYALRCEMIYRDRPQLRHFPSVDGQVMATYDIRKYHRQPAILDYSAKWSGRFGKKQGYLSAALLHQYVANLKRK